MSKEKFAEFLSRLLPQPVERQLPAEIKDLVARGATFVINHSGGKDSQAMTSFLRRHIPQEQLVVVHALLPDVEWEGVEEHVRATTQGLPVHTCRSRRTLLEMIEERGMFPSPSQRQCTSDLKRGPIEKTIRHLLDANGAPVKLIVNCMGMRAEESPNRSKLQDFKFSERNSKAGREWHEWLPIHDWTIEEVFSEIFAAGQKPHWAYYEGMSRLSCCFCLSGETEVVTRDGIRQIKDLADGEHDLLIPKVGPLGMSTIGGFRRVPVMNFGVQKLYAIELTTSKRQKKTLYATAEHRWYLDGESEAVVTTDLQPGNVLKRLEAVEMNRAEEVPFAVAQGFVYGDGTKGSGERPASLTIYNANKDGVMLRYFAAHRIQKMNRGQTKIYGLPRTWKSLPDIRESRSFLLSWLAGYFAADGCVSKEGAARIDSSSLKSIEFARDIAAICGIQYGQIRTTHRKGTGSELTPLFSLNLSPEKIPDWFFVNKTHLERIKRYREISRGLAQKWRVARVYDAERLEPVYCAVVPGAKAFGLVDGLVTGNCIMASKEDLTTAARLNPALYARYVGLERSTGQVMLMPTKKHGRQTLEDVTGIKAVIPIKLITEPEECAA